MNNNRKKTKIYIHAPLLFFLLFFYYSCILCCFRSGWASFYSLVVQVIIILKQWNLFIAHYFIHLFSSRKFFSIYFLVIRILFRIFIKDLSLSHENFMHASVRFQKNNNGTWMKLFWSVFDSFTTSDHFLVYILCFITSYLTINYDDFYCRQSPLWSISYKA